MSHICFELISYLAESCFINRDIRALSLSLSVFHSLSFLVILSQSTYIYIHIYMDKEVHCTFRCVVVFSG